MALSNQVTPPADASNYSFRNDTDVSSSIYGQNPSALHLHVYFFEDRNKENLRIYKPSRPVLMQHLLIIFKY